MPGPVVAGAVASKGGVGAVGGGVKLPPGIMTEGVSSDAQRKSSGPSIVIRSSVNPIEAVAKAMGDLQGPERQVYAHDLSDGARPVTNSALSPTQALIGVPEELYRERKQEAGAEAEGGEAKNNEEDEEDEEDLLAAQEELEALERSRMGCY